MTKKGQLAVIILFIILLAIITGTSIFTKFKHFGSSKDTLKLEASRDIAFILNTIYASPYDVEVDGYDVDLSGFKVEISKNEFGEFNVKVDDREYSFVPVNDNPNFIFDGPNKLIFSKKDGKVTITT